MSENEKGPHVAGLADIADWNKGYRNSVSVSRD